jgi:ferritin-like metal-binding protein YciE
MKVNSMEDLLIHELQDLYSAEKQLAKVLPRMARVTTNSSLSDLFRQHCAETQIHVARLEDILSNLGAHTCCPPCKAMEGLIAEADQLLADVDDDSVKDAAIIGAAQRVEHYEIAGYGTARTYAQLLGNQKVAEILQRTLDEEHATDVKLTTLAVSGINRAAEPIDSLGAEDKPEIDGK